MKFNKVFPNKSFAAFIASLALLGGCANHGDQTASSDPVVSPSVASSPIVESPAASPQTDHSAPTQGGQVVETGAYHLELVALPEASSTHLDLFLQTGDTHEAVEGATVIGQVQLPDGSQQEVSFEYDAEGKHYAALLPETASGEHKVVILTNINGEKVNGRFSFTK